VYRTYYALISVLKSESVLGKKKIKIFKTLIRPVATCGVESWTLNHGIAKQLATSQRKGLRTIFGGIKIHED
jgi:hypothetical protein